MIRPILYCDVDNVLNAAHRGFGDLTVGLAKPTDSARTYRIRWAPKLIEELNALDVDLVWATTWRNDAETIIAPLVGLELPSRVLHPLPEYPEYFIGRRSSIHWKIESLIADQTESPSKFIWLEDEMLPEHRRTAKALGGYAPKIDPDYGITTDIIKEIHKYLNS